MEVIRIPEGFYPIFRGISRLGKMRQSTLPHGGLIDVRRRSPYPGTTPRSRPGHSPEATLATRPDPRPRQTGTDRPGHRRRPGMLTQGRCEPTTHRGAWRVTTTV